HDGFNVPFTLTVVDTPGFGDTRGIKRDKEITEQIRRLFTSSNGVGEIDAVCFVTQASLARLTATQRYVFDSVLSIFGKDVAENIKMLVTFSDGQQPPVLEAINVSGVPCPKNDIGLPVHFKFNNSALFADNRSISDRACDEGSDEDDDNFDEIFWNMGLKSMEKFFTALDMMVSLMDQSARSITRLQEIALRQNPLTTPDYIDMLIEGEKSEAKDGYQTRIKSLEAMKEKAKIISKVKAAVSDVQPVQATAQCDEKSTNKRTSVDTHD
ncbi:hypothetical protein GBF38_015881, partial [Nibea albiflora]